MVLKEKPDFNLLSPIEDPVEVGLYAIGNIDRTIYLGAFPDGTAIRFESFQVWGSKGEQA